MVRQESLLELYTAFNARDVDTVLAAMAPDVEWPNGWEGGFVHGHDEVRAYWTRQWAEIDSRAEPIEITQRGEDEVEVRVQLQARDAAGQVVFDKQALHVYSFRGGLIERMRIEEPGS